MTTDKTSGEWMPIESAAMRSKCTYCGMPSVTTLDGDPLCFDHANLWVRSEGQWQRQQEAGHELGF